MYHIFYFVRCYNMLKGNFEIWNSFICQDYLWNETQYPHEAKIYMTLLFVTYVFIVFVSDYSYDDF